MVDFPQLVARFNEHLALARNTPGITEPSAFALATVGPGDRPAVRIMLLKALDSRGFVFYTNTLSRKGRELSAHDRVAMCFWWGPLARQVRIEGRIEPVTAAEADAYFATRPRGSQIGAWASNQSRPLASRDELLAAQRTLEERYGNAPIPRPPHWTGFRVVPDLVEFWYGREDRLHERYEFRRDGDRWIERILSP